MSVNFAEIAFLFYGCPLLVTAKIKVDDNITHLLAVSSLAVCH
jgi:hypothetical protein